jgi:cytochrome c5
MKAFGYSLAAIAMGGLLTIGTARAGQVERMELFSADVIQAVAVAALAPDDAIPEIYERTCQACLDLNVPAPDEDLSTSERLERRYPGRDFTLAALGTWRFEAYPPVNDKLARMASSLRARGGPCD